jgi:peptide/nickel transport system substrate-binding protein
MQERVIPITRRGLSRLIMAGGAGLAVSALPGRARAARKDVLVIGIDISDTITLDPARQGQYTPPITLEAAYDTLVTMTPGDYVNVKPALATAWARTPDGKGWRFTLRKGVKFSTGNPMTVDDVKWSFDRVINLKDQPQQYIANISAVNVVDPNTIDIILKKPEEPILTILAAPAFVVYERKVVEQHGGNAGPQASTEDKATEWLNQHSAGTGAYTLAAWARNAQIQLVRNPHSWRGTPGFQRIVIRHIPDSAAQLLAIQRGDVDAAFNLIPEQVAPLKSDPKVRVEKLESLDFVYMAVTQEPAFNKALAVKEARQAIGYAIDYDGIRDKLLGGAATRCASFLPIGVRGSTEEVVKQIGFRQDLDHAKQLLQKAGLTEGFEFELSYGNAAIAGVSYQLLGQKIQSDLARVGIRVRLNPMDQVNLRTQYTTGKSTSVLTFWNPPAVENELWAAATVERLAKRVHWTPPAELVQLVHQAAAETDPQKQAQMWIEYQKAMVDQANLIILFQPIYQIAVRDTVKAFPLTAAGWQVDLSGAQA